ncbi:M56 family metallopeptidase [Clostridium tagluense]|uniref:M56 family metallopeptidase n=1 Tax=Clostridium tagluense TaxID=360422 RepID=UPI001CF4BFDA|nr:M56 family metallopeptidase [Clostridium tagluense]MCB2311402.1 M56 family metallopeptidase [Clostridium tagluense]MCB2316126.1 M56 family metallopeptidase [Clostridium tagluense]MCB2321071.1 M56 family metallopeptidase [Clostridium tagluense]MCB2326087.1 M56 family metallopeptidase [Clostridium tagluense]MCB2330810.1 M56 family metallopeptidase [Clostridium tagluense]
MNWANLFEQIILLSIMGSIVSMAILVIKAVFRKKLSAKVHYYIWFLLVLKIIIPLNIQSNLNPFNFINGESQRYDVYSIVKQNLSSGTTLDINNSTNINKIQESSVVKENYENTRVVDNNRLGFNYKTGALIWLIGVLSILLYIIIVNIMLWISIKKSPHCERTDIDKILQVAKSRLKVNSKISVIYEKHLKSPAVYGIIRPKILISENIINRLTPEELKFVFLHEVTHIKRKDLVVNVIIMLLQVIYWFNPLIWYSLYQFKQDCEVACDATALTVLSSKEVIEYGQTIINMLKILSKSDLAMGTLGFSNKYSKRRITMITLFSKKSITWTIVALSLVLMVGCSSITKPSNDNKGKEEVTTISNVQSDAEGNTSSSNNDAKEAKEAKDTDSDSAESIITKYINTYYTITKEDIELYKKIIGGNKDINILLSDINKANEKFKKLMTETAYAAIITDRVSYLRCKEANESNYYVAVKSIKLEKYSEETQTKVYYYDVEVTQRSISGNKVKNIKDRKQIAVSKVKGNWKVSKAYTYGY